MGVAGTSQPTSGGGWPWELLSGRGKDRRRVLKGSFPPCYRHGKRGRNRMFDPMKLLGEMMDSQASPTAAGRLDAALSRGGLSAPGSPLAQFLQGGAAGQSSGPGAGGGFGDLLNNLLGAAQQGFGQAKEQVQQNNPLAIGGLGALAGAILGGGKGAVGGGLMAVMGSLAYSALQRASQQQQISGDAA